MTHTERNNNNKVRKDKVYNLREEGVVYTVYLQV